MATKRNESENLTDANLEKVSKLLAAEKPITKKAACEMLSISYNTARLDKLLTEYHERKAYVKSQRAKKRYTPASPQEVDFVVSSYLEGAPINKISDQLFRPASFVTNTLERVGCPKRLTGHDYWKPELIPEVACRTEFAEGEKVWSARYNSMALVEHRLPNQPDVYRIWLLAEEWQQKAYQPYWELASLDHLKQQGIKI